tara:strand:- start:885 stop:1058 length:174 start_codon:yes stop_codon:yes gene_type:complete
METIAMILFGAGCFVLGMYTTTQLGQWIDGRIVSKNQNEKLLDNIKKMDQNNKKATR